MCLAAFSPALAPRSATAAVSKLSLSKVCMESATEEIVEKLKTMTLLEATELHHALEELNGVKKDDDDAEDEAPAAEAEAPAEE